jgi:hypothetical protein
VSILDGIPEPIRTIIEERAHELYHERETAGDQGFSDSMKMARFIEELNAEQLGTLRELIKICSEPTRQSMVYGLITGAIIYKHGLNWEGQSAEEELLGHHESDIKKDNVDWDKHVETLPMEDSPVQGDLRAVTEDWERRRNIPAADRGKWSESEYEAFMGVYGIAINDPGNMRCTGCDVFVHSLTDRMLREPGVEGCGTCQKKAKFG